MEGRILWADEGRVLRDFQVSKQSVLEILFFKGEKCLLASVWFWPDKKASALWCPQLWYLWHRVQNLETDPGSIPVSHTHWSRSWHVTHTKLKQSFFCNFQEKDVHFYAHFSAIPETWECSEVGAVGNLLLPCDAGNWSQYDRRQSKEMERNQVLIIFSGTWIQSCHFMRGIISLFFVQMHFIVFSFNCDQKSIWLMPSSKRLRWNREGEMQTFNK